jgi:general secretion pathway protein C
MSAVESIKSHLGNLFRSGKTQAALRFSVTLLLLFLVARTGADLTWQAGASFLSKGRSAPPGQLPGQKAPAGPRTSQNRLPAATEEIALFGQAAGALSPQGGLVETAPATNLNLVLKGIVAVRPMRRALAIIAERGSATEQLYSQGEEISGNVVIREIHPDRVIISRTGILETLYLEGFDKPAPTAGPVPRTAAPRAAGDYIQPRGDGINWQIKRDYWDEKLADVPGLAKEVGVEVYSENSQQKGYRLVAVQNSKLLNTLGLLPGDILLSVNGRAMNNIQEGLAAYQLVKNGGQVTVEINRNGRRESRVYNIGG